MVLKATGKWIDTLPIRDLLVDVAEEFEKKKD